MSELVYLVHKETKQSTEVPDDETVLKDYAERGWLPTERPGPVPFIPSPDGQGGKVLDPNDYNPAPVPVADPPKIKKVT